MIMDIKIKEDLKEFVAIEYPGKVVNPDKMIETLGGIEDLSKGFCEKQKLQLKLRQNFYTKPILSTEPNEATGMLLKVKVRRSKKNREKKPQIVSTELVGTATTMYKFNNFGDYQYLPIQRNEKTGKTENIYYDIVPEDITTGPSWFRDKLDVPIFLPPAAFVRSDTMQFVSFKNEVKLTNEDGDETAKFAMTNRLSRATNGISILFSMTDPIPIKANDSVKDIVKSNLVTQVQYDAVHNLFKDRPIWTLASIRAHIRSPPRRLNYALAAMAYYYTSGPWRNCFVRFGYDPRKSFESRYFQMLDYRVRQGAGLKGELKISRHNGINRRVRVPVKTENVCHDDDDEVEENFQLRRRQAIFAIDTIPPFRARHYQFIDIHIPKIQDMLLKIPTVISGALCNEKRGWLPMGFMEQCRDILTVIAQANMLKLCNEKNISVEEFKKAEEIKSEPTIEDDEGDESGTEETDSQFPEDIEPEIDEEIDE